jgi:hypothetical protein
MGLAVDPDFVRVFRHPLGIPQYVVGHLDRLARIDALLSRHPGLFLAGNGYGGVAINACVAGAAPLAERILARGPGRLSPEAGPLHSERGAAALGSPSAGAASDRPRTSTTGTTPTSGP